MYYTQLLQLKGMVSKKDIEKFDNYLSKLTKENSQRITVSKVYSSTGIAPDVCREILNECERNGLLSQKFIVICPKCGGMIKELQDFNEMEEITYCYMCTSELKIEREDITTAYNLREVSK